MSIEECKYPKKAKPVSQHDKLIKNLIEFLRVYQVEWNTEWEVDLPKKWKLVSNDLLILPASCFTLSIWTELNERTDGGLWKCVADCFKVKRVAQENRVKSDDYRSPNLNLLYGIDSIVQVVNNGVKYSYDITKSMFSWGNITEKLRIAEFDCSNETVVDLFAGIGYFTLVYLIHAKAKQVVAIEWNPASVEALKTNLELNKCQDRCLVLQGDNRQVCPSNIADRVNLGLIPSSELSWPTACNALRVHTGGYLHIHGNVDIKETCKSTKLKPDWIEWSEYTRNRINQLLDERDSSVKWSVSVEHIEYVKSYGPRVDHLVLDVLCRPQRS